MSIQLDAMLESSADVCGGRLRIAGTRITVQQIAVLHQRGETARSIVEQCPYLTLAQVYAALAYYHANREEVDSQLAREGEQYDHLKRAHKREWGMNEIPSQGYDIGEKI